MVVRDLVVGAGTGAEVHIAAVAVNNGAAVVRPGAVGHRGDGFRDSFRLLGRAVVGGGEDQIVGGDVTGVIAVAHLIPAVQDRQDLNLGAVGEIGDGGSVRGGLDADPQGNRRLLHRCPYRRQRPVAVRKTTDRAVRSRAFFAIFLIRVSSSNLILSALPSPAGGGLPA